MPSFYISGYFEEYRNQYHHRLGAISDQGDWLSWIKFYLEAVVSQASRNLDLVREVKSLYEQMKQEITELRRSEVSIHLLGFCFDSPVFHAPDLLQALNIQRQRAAGYISSSLLQGLLQSFVLRQGNAALFYHLNLFATLRIVSTARVAIPIAITLNNSVL